MQRVSVNNSNTIKDFFFLFIFFFFWEEVGCGGKKKKKPDLKCWFIDVNNFPGLL